MNFRGVFCLLLTIQAMPAEAEVVRVGTPPEHTIHRERIYEAVNRTVYDINTGAFVRPLEVMLPDGQGGNGEKTTAYIRYVKETFSNCKNPSMFRGSAGDTDRDVAYMAAGFSFSCYGLKGVGNRELLVVLDDSFQPIAIFVRNNVLHTVLPPGEGG